MLNPFHFGSLLIVTFLSMLQDKDPVIDMPAATDTDVLMKFLLLILAITIKNILSMS